MKGKAMRVHRERQVQRVLATYAADISGVCSALYELGGMTVMDDASGCHSTYTTHDEPRWATMPSQVFLGGLTEMDAILGNERRLVEDTIDACERLKPRFVCLIGTPVPMMMGTDLDALAREAGEATGTPGFGITANCMQSYGWGVAQALSAVAERFVEEPAEPFPRAFEGNRPCRVNVLGLTPLDYALTGADRAFADNLRAAGFEVQSTWAMGELGTLERIAASARADVNLVVSAGGTGPAKTLAERFGMPWTTGIPAGATLPELKERLLAAARGEAAPETACGIAPDMREADFEPLGAIIGDPVQCAWIRAELEARRAGLAPARLVAPYPIDNGAGVMDPARGDLLGLGETEIERMLAAAPYVIGDPVFRHLLPAGGSCRLLALPHPALSGRMYSGSLFDWGRDDVCDRLGIAPAAPANWWY
ncbi:MAG: oxidoreductase [Duodenibacillus sp.]|nr:oxidoreductase [Duodenibacillus sp.]